MGKEKIIQLIMRRDNLSYEEAFETVQDCIDEIHELLSDYGNIPPYALYNQVTDIINDYLGLEPDYLDDLVYN